MADTTGGEIPSSDSNKDTMCDSQSDVESTAATNGTSSGGDTATLTEANELDSSSQNEPTSMGVPSPSSTTVDSSVSSCGGNSLDEAKRDDSRPSPQSTSSTSSPLPSSFSVCSPLVSSCGGGSSSISNRSSPMFAASRLSFAASRCSPSSPSNSAAHSPPPPHSSLSSPTTSSSSFSLRPPPPSRPLVLRPSQLGGGGGASSSSGAAVPRVNSPFVLKAPKLLSPFSSAKQNEQDEQNSAEAEPLCVPEKETTAAAVSSNVQETCSSTDNVTSSSSPTRPMVASSSTTSSASPSPQPLPSSSSSTSTTPLASAAPAPAPTTTTTPPQMSFVPLSAPKVGGGGSGGGAESAGGSSGGPPVAAAAAAASSTASASRFVFGQNLHERVIVESSTLDTAGSCASESVSVSNNGEDSCSSASAATTNGTSEMLFSSVIQKELPDKSAENNVDDKNRKSLSEAAREYEESRAIKRKYEEVAVVTGEEEENNILQMDCKLFVYDNNKTNYSEGVHGMLRVNDPPSCAKKSTAQSSRVIVRMSGSLRVLLNTKIWADMKIEKPNRKIVRMTAMDTNGQIKVFLISSSPSESEMLFRVLDARIKQQKETAVNCQNGNGSDNNKTEDADECTSSSPS